MLKLLFVFSVIAPSLGVAATARTCESVFRSATKQSSITSETAPDPATSSANFLDRHIRDSGLERLSKSQLVTLFTLRDRIHVGDVKQIETLIEDEVEAQLISLITKRAWKIGDAVRMSQFENQIALPSFKRIAFKAAALRMRMLQNVDADEVFQAAMIGLVDAIRIYRADAETMFSTWAFMRMRNEFAEVARESTAGIAMASSSGAYSRLVSYLGIVRELRRKLGRMPTLAEVSNRHGNLYSVQASEKEISEALSRHRVAKLSGSVYEAEPKTSQAIDEGASHQVDAFEMLASDSTPVSVLEARQLSETLSRMLFSLTPRERIVMGLQYGLSTREDGDLYTASATDTYTLDEIGSMFGVTRERIRQIESKAIRKMKHPSRSDSLRSMLPNDFGG